MLSVRGFCISKTCRSGGVWYPIEGQIQVGEPSVFARDFKIAEQIPPLDGKRDIPGELNSQRTSQRRGHRDRARSRVGCTRRLLFRLLRPFRILPQGVAVSCCPHWDEPSGRRSGQWKAKWPVEGEVDREVGHLAGMIVVP